MSTQSFHSILLIGYAALALAIAGCSSPATYPDGNLIPIEKLGRATSSDEADSDSRESHSVPSPPPGTAPSDDELLEVLSQAHWVQSVRVAGDEEPEYRWIYPALEDRLSQGAVGRHNLQMHLKSPEPIIAANAAIGLQRMGGTDVAQQLAEAVGNRRLDIRMRCSAAEALGRVSNGLGSLQRLLDEEVEQSRRTYSPACHSELVRALGHQAHPADEPRLVSALSAQDDEVKLAALSVWQKSSGGTFPEEGLALRDHRDPRIRAELPPVLARHPSDGTLDLLSLALSDPDLQVRSATIRALGTLGDERAVATLEPFLSEGVEGERISAVRALADLGQTEAVLGASRDKSWRVRLAVAEVFPDLPGEPDPKFARGLLEDASAAVQHQAVVAMRSWPPAIAEPLLLDALETCPYRSQKAAAESLAETWADGRVLLETFPFGQPASARIPALAELRKAYRERQSSPKKQPAERELAFSREQLASVVASLRTMQSSAVDTREYSEAMASLPQVDPTLIEMLEYLVDQRGIVLPDCVFELLATEMSDFGTVEYLRSNDVQVRQRAARRLAEGSVRRHASPLLLRRLANLAITEEDAVVWQYLLATLADRGDPQTLRLVYAAAGHDSEGIRQAACQHLKRHPHPQHADLLTATLNDESALVVCAALEALGICGGEVDPAPILAHLNARSEAVQIAAAVALTHFGRPEGPAALEQLAYSSNDQTRLHVARVMGELALSEFAPSLIRLLNDRHGVRLAALESLPKVAECEEASAIDLRESERVAAWQRWAMAGNMTVE